MDQQQGWYLAIPIISLGIALGSFFVSFIQVRRHLRNTSMQPLEKRLEFLSDEIDDLKEKVEECERDREATAQRNRELVEENLLLMRRLLGGPKPRAQGG